MSENEDWLRKDKFGSGIFWELYKDLERQFQNFLEYVPYIDENENVFSFKLVNLILSIGGHVDSAFKEMARYKGFADNADCQEIVKKLRSSEKKVKIGKAPETVSISLSLRAFEREYNLSKRKVIFKRLPEAEEITPYEPHNPKTNAPQWWEIYNGLKHDVSIHIKQANLKNTLHALASAFLLNVIHYSAALRLFEHNISKISYLSPKQVLSPTKKVGDIFLEWFEKRKLEGSVETALFIYDYSP